MQVYFQSKTQVNFPFKATWKNVPFNSFKFLCLSHYSHPAVCVTTHSYLNYYYKYFNPYVIYHILHLCPRPNKLQIQSKGRKIKSRLWSSFSPISFFFSFLCDFWQQFQPAVCRWTWEISDTMAQETENQRGSSSEGTSQPWRREWKYGEVVCACERQRENELVRVHACEWESMSVLVGSCRSGSEWICEIKHWWKWISLYVSEGSEKDALI